MTDIFRRRRRWSWLALLGLALAVAALGAAVGAGAGYRLGVLDLAAAFDSLRLAAWTGLAAVVVSVGGVVRARPGSGRRGLTAALLGVAVGAAVFWFPFDMRRAGQQVPPIHDITTDTANPPQFDAVLALRADAPNTARYPGAEVARMQKQAYPDIRPARFDLPPETVFAAAHETARELGWDIVAALPRKGRIEATATTLWFGFRDDVVVRVTSDDGGAVVDVRSVSRVGRSDLGKNAERIREYLARLDETLAAGE